jgi:glycosyltransferase involved in cell wall biosynthesis
MKIALVVLTRGSLSGGSRKHLLEVVPRLRKHPDVRRLDVLVPEALEQYGDASWPERDEYFGFNRLRRMLAVLEPDVIFIPTSRLLRRPGIPTVIMVRNMEPLELPFGGNAVAEGMKNVARAFATRAACLRADRVIAVSNHVRDHLRAKWHVPESQIGVVYHGVGSPESAGTPPSDDPRFRAPSRFIFTAGSIRPARGLEDAIHALPAIPEDVRLVIAGAVDRGAQPYARMLNSTIAQLGLTSRVIWVGQLNQGQMTWCFRHAAAFVMTSRAEACPNTVLEALAAGAVSVSTDHSPMPEFFGGVALYYRERDSANLAMRVNEALRLTGEDRERLSKGAMKRASRYSWEETARRTADELRYVAEGR